MLKLHELSFYLIVYVMGKRCEFHAITGPKYSQTFFSENLDAEVI